MHWSAHTGKRAIRLAWDFIRYHPQLILLQKQSWAFSRNTLAFWKVNFKKDAPNPSYHEVDMRFLFANRRWAPALISPVLGFCVKIRNPVILYNIAVFGEKYFKPWVSKSWQSVSHACGFYSGWEVVCFPFTNLGTIRAHPENGRLLCAASLSLELVPSVYWPSCICVSGRILSLT